MLVAFEDNVLAEAVRDDGICNEFSILSEVTTLFYNKRVYSFKTFSIIILLLFKIYNNNKIKY